MGLSKKKVSTQSEELVSKESQRLETPRTLVACGLIDTNHYYIQYLSDLGYIVEKMPSAVGLKQHIISQIPNVLLLDMDGLGDETIHITKTLKENPLTYSMPIIIVLGSRNLNKEIATLDAGAEDFLAKPFVPQVLASRIYTSIRRNIRLQISNPLTGLPGAIYIEEQTSKRLENQLPVAMCYVDLIDFKAFNDKYSYNRGDVVIKLLATILNEGVSLYCKPGDFVGHIGGDDFVIITVPECIDDVCQYVITSFDTLIPFQYDEKDMEREYFVSVNRQGVKKRFALMTVSIGVVTNTNREIQSYLEMTELAAEMKSFAKSVTKAGPRQSVYKIDQRTH